MRGGPRGGPAWALGFGLYLGPSRRWRDPLFGGQMPWQLVLDPDTARYHTSPPKDSEQQIRIPVTPREAPEMETLLWSVDSVRAGGGRLGFRWATTLVALELRVQPSQRLTATADEAVGMPSTFEVVFDAELGRLSGTVAYGDGVPPMEMMLLPAADGIFNLGWGVDGELWEVMPIVIGFSSSGGGVFDGFDVRDQASDDVLWSGHRSARPSGP